MFYYILLSPTSNQSFILSSYFLSLFLFASLHLFSSSKFSFSLSLSLLSLSVDSLSHFFFRFSFFFVFDPFLFPFLISCSLFIFHHSLSRSQILFSSPYLLLSHC